MDDRIVEYPNRYRQYPVPGQEGVVDLVPEPGKISQAGTPISKQTLLQDYTCKLLGIPTTSTVDDAFLKLSLGTGKYGWLVHVQFWDGTPAEGVVVSGAENSTPTNHDGDTMLISSTSTVSLGVPSPKWIDVQALPAKSVQSTGTLTPVTLILQRKSGEVQITGSRSFEVSPVARTMDACAVGAGGGGGYATEGRGGFDGDGGGGGYVRNAMAVPLGADRTVSIQIGSGGSGGTNPGTGFGGGHDGGSTTVSLGGKPVLTAEGGKGGSKGGYGGGIGNGSGGRAQFSSNMGQPIYPADANGRSGSGFKFGDRRLGVPGGGGGAGAFNCLYTPVPPGKPAGGAPNGAAGSYRNKNGEVVYSSTGTFPGGGGGGGASAFNGPGGRGANGCAWLRFHY